MSFGKLYTNDSNGRSTAIRVVAKINNLDLEIVDTPVGANATAEYLQLNKLGKIPTFVGADGYVLTESIAIAIYLTSQNEKTTLLGKTKQDYASILRWMSFSNSDVLTQVYRWVLPLVGYVPYNKKAVEEAQAASLKCLSVFEHHLTANTYLVGERITLADLFVAGVLAPTFKYVLDKKFLADHPAFARWFDTVVNQPDYAAVAPKVEYTETALPNQAPKKEAAPAKAPAPAKAAAPKAAAAEEAEPAPAPKPKHPLEELGRPTFALDDWKRKYSNAETREEAIPWFWENMNFEEYSLWSVDYRYNDELTMVFMSSNLIGGFFTRLEASRKYIFGSVSVYGENNNSVIRGVLLVRGQEILPAVDVGPDYESYEFKKLDPTNAEDRTFVEDQFAWDKPIEYNGKTYQHADGKIYK